MGSGEPELYQINFHMLQEENEINRRLKESIACISKNRFDDATMARLIYDTRSLVYVLADSSWTVLCVIQVYLEGKFTEIKSRQSRSLSGTPLRDCFNNFEILPQGLTGAKIFRLYAQTEVDASIALDILTRFYDGEKIINMRQLYKGSLVSLHESWLPRIRYFGVRLVTNDVNDFLNWEKCGFEPLYVGEFKSSIGGTIESVECSCYLMKIFKFFNITINRYYHSSLNKTAESSQSMFCHMLVSQGKDFCPFFALRIIKSFDELKQRKGPCASPRVVDVVRVIKSFDEIRQRNRQCELLWDTDDAERVTDFLYGSKKFSPAITGLIPGVAMAYFTGKLPAKMTEDEEVTLLMMGLQLKSRDQTTSVISLGSTQYTKMYRKLFRTAFAIYCTFTKKAR